MADHKLGRFIFVFSPSDKLDAISGKLSRATVVSVGDLTERQALDFLQLTGCDADRAAVVHALVDGHLPFLMQEPVGSFCRGEIGLDILKTHFVTLVRAIFEHVDQVLDCGREDCACKAACAIRDKSRLSDLTRAIPLLLKEHILRASLKEKILTIDSRFVLCYLARECACNSTVLSPPCATW